MPKKEDWAKQVYHLFVIRNKKRDKLIEYLKEHNIQTAISLPKLKAYKYLNQDSEDFFANKNDINLLSLPIGEHINFDETKKIVNTIKKFV